MAPLTVNNISAAGRQTLPIRISPGSRANRPHFIALAYYILRLFLRAQNMRHRSEASMDRLFVAALQSFSRLSVCNPQMRGRLVELPAMAYATAASRNANGTRARAWVNARFAL